MSIRFSSQDVSFQLTEAPRVARWIEKVITMHGQRCGSINYNFCSDDHILQVNQQFLNHDTYTDIITFDRVCGNLVSGDILISIDRVKENAVLMNTTFELELHRVLVHGVLHLLGFKDKTDADARQMRSKEDEALHLYEEL